MPEQDNRSAEEPSTRKALLTLAALLVVGVAAVTLIRAKTEAAVSLAVNYPAPTRFEHVPLPELLSSPARYNGKMIETEGYLRFSTFLMNVDSPVGEEGPKLEFQRDPPHRALFALSPVPINLALEPRGGTLGKTGVTNLLVTTHLLLELGKDFNQGDQTNITPHRRVLGLFTNEGEEKHLRLYHWSKE